MYQVQGQLAIYQLLWCDFFVWTKKDSMTERIAFDADKWKEIYEKLYTFYVNNFCAELFSSRLERKVPLFS